MFTDQNTVLVINATENKNAKKGILSVSYVQNGEGDWVCKSYKVEEVADMMLAVRDTYKNVDTFKQTTDYEALANVVLHCKELVKYVEHTSARHQIGSCTDEFVGEVVYHLIEKLFDLNDLSHLEKSIFSMAYNRTADLCKAQKTKTIFPSIQDIGCFADEIHYGMTQKDFVFLENAAATFLDKLKKYGRLKKDVKENLCSPVAFLSMILEDKDYNFYSISKLVDEWSTNAYRNQVEFVSLDDENCPVHAMADENSNVEALYIRKELLKEIVDTLEGETSSLRVMSFLYVTGAENTPLHVARQVASMSSLTYRFFVKHTLYAFYDRNGLKLDEQLFAQFTDMDNPYQGMEERLLAGKISHMLDKLQNKLRRRLNPENEILVA